MGGTQEGKKLASRGEGTRVAAGPTRMPGVHFTVVKAGEAAVAADTSGEDSAG